MSINRTSRLKRKRSTSSSGENNYLLSRLSLKDVPYNTQKSKGRSRSLSIDTKSRDNDEVKGKPRLRGCDGSGNMESGKERLSNSYKRHKSSGLHKETRTDSKTSRKSARQSAKREVTKTEKDSLNNVKLQRILDTRRQKFRESLKRWKEQLKKERPLTSTKLSEKDIASDPNDDNTDVAQADDTLEKDTLDVYMQKIESDLSTTYNNENKTSVIKSESENSKTPIDSMKMESTTNQIKNTSLSSVEMDEVGCDMKEEDEMLIKDKVIYSELLVADHTQIKYEPFKKNVYVQVPELCKMTTEEVDEYRKHKGINVRGKHCPTPIKSWAQCGCGKTVMNVLRRHYNSPTPIQAQAIPAIMSGKDFIGIAEAGSGKTLAFLIPMFRHIENQPKLSLGDGPIGILMAPTRELARQIATECAKYTKRLGLRVVPVYGGMDIPKQVAELKQGGEIIVCTPGRMIDMLCANNGKVTNLRKCTYVVIDEADRMFDLGFEPQVMKILDNIRPDRQTVMFSATFPRQMEALARRILNKPVEVQIGHRSVVCKDVEQHVIVIDEENKYLKLLELLGLYQEHGSVLVFVSTQKRSDDLMKNLMKHYYPCMSLHGGIDQSDRDSIISDFKNGITRLLISTSVAARGLDVKNLKLVVNYDCTNHYEDYVHRCGRTGRAGNKGTAFTFITPEEEKYSGDIIKALDVSGHSVPNDLKQMWDLYKKKSNVEGRKVHRNNGFKCKGFKFDEAEAQLATEKKRLQKIALGFDDSDSDDDGFEPETSKNTNIQPTALSAISYHQQDIITEENTSKQSLSSPVNLVTPQISQEMSNSELKRESTSTVLAKRVAEQINFRLRQRGCYQRESKKDTPDHYREEVEINDFPSAVRWKVTSKAFLNQIYEFSEAAVSVRGRYCQPGSYLKDEERKLHLLIEGASQMVIQKAKMEIAQKIKEETNRLSNKLSTKTQGQYKVL